MNITNIDLLIRFNKTRKIFPSATQVLSILLTAAASIASVKGVSCKERIYSSSYQFAVGISRWSPATQFFYEQPKT